MVFEFCGKFWVGGFVCSESVILCVFCVWIFFFSILISVNIVWNFECVMVLVKFFVSSDNFVFI